MRIIPVRLSPDKNGHHDPQAARRVISNQLWEISADEPVIVIICLYGYKFASPHNWTISALAWWAATHPKAKIHVQSPNPQVGASWQQAIDSETRKLNRSAAVSNG